MIYKTNYNLEIEKVEKIEKKVQKNFGKNPAIDTSFLPDPLRDI